jgi:hypothetical protein
MPLTDRYQKSTTSFTAVKYLGRQFDGMEETLHSIRSLPLVRREILSKCASAVAILAINHRAPRCAHAFVSWQVLMQFTALQTWTIPLNDDVDVCYISP